MPKATKKMKSKKSHQKLINMVGCSKNHKHLKTCKKNKRRVRLGTKRHYKHNGGGGCGSCGCPVGGLTWSEMNKYGGKSNFFPLNSVPNATVPLNYGPALGASGQIGGSCAMCSAIPVHSGGGHFYKPPSLVPGPFVGSAWGPNVSQWPAIDGVGGDRNYFNPYNLNKDPALQMSLNDAGYKTAYSKVGGRKRRSNKKGGGVMPQDLTNLGNNLGFNFKSAYNALNGYPAPVNPLPYKDQLSNSLNSSKLMY